MTAVIAPELIPEEDMVEDSALGSLTMESISSNIFPDDILSIDNSFQ